MEEKNFLVTGGCGFIGSSFINKHFILYPDSYFVNIDSLYNKSVENNIHKLVSESSRYIFVEGNICDYDLVMHILKTYEIDVVIHFAGRKNNKADLLMDSWKYIQDNIIGTHTLLEACKRYNYLDKFIYISTNKVFGETQSDLHNNCSEQWVVCPTNPQAVSKASAELLVTSYYHTFNLPVIITRLNNVYGLHQSPENILPSFISSLKKKQKIKIHGDGSNIRAFTHVYDVTNAIDLIIQNGSIGEIYHLDNPQDECSIIDLAKGLILLMVSDKFSTAEDFEPYIEFIEDAKTSDKRYFSRNDKLQKIGWFPEISLIDGLVEMIKTDTSTSTST